MMDDALRALVRERAGGRCEYCQLHQDEYEFQVFVPSTSVAATSETVSGLNRIGAPRESHSSKRCTAHLTTQDFV